MGQTEAEVPPQPSATPDAAQPVEGPVEECHPPCTIASQTFKTSPADRTRTKVGVGEEVTITVTGNPATWEIDTGGTITPSGAEANSVTFTAGETAASATITATGVGCGCVNSITFDVVEPDSFTMRRKGATLEHNNPWPDCGWTGMIYVHPNDVNFYRVQVREVDSRAVTSGCYATALQTGAYHGNYPPPARVSPWIAVTSHTEARGSKTTVTDHIYSGRPLSSWAGGANPPFMAGTMYYPMTWHWRVRGSANHKDFPHFRQSHRVTAPGRCTSSKAGNSESCMYSDPTSVRG
jgi:type VI secretion system secreted protein VgrG